MPDGRVHSSLRRNPRPATDPEGIPPGARFKPDPRLLIQGWQFRFVAGGPRLKETVELYEQLGYEALAEPVPAEAFADECEGCQVVALMQFRMIYTRKRPRSVKGPLSQGGGAAR